MSMAFSAQEMASQWFMPLIYFAAALLQIGVYVSSEKKLAESGRVRLRVVRRDRKWREHVFSDLGDRSGVGDGKCRYVSPVFGFRNFDLQHLEPKAVPGKSELEGMPRLHFGPVSSARSTGRLCFK